MVMNGRNRAAIRPGMAVDVVLKRDQRTGKRTWGIVAEILTNSSFHPHGIKVRLRVARSGGCRRSSVRECTSRRRDHPRSVPVLAPESVNLMAAPCPGSPLTRSSAQIFPP